MSPNKCCDNEIKTVYKSHILNEVMWGDSIQWHEIAEIGYFVAKTYLSLPFYINFS